MLALLAQQGPPAANPQAAAGILAFLGVFYCGLFVIIIATIAMMIWLYVKMSNALSQCRPRNRTMEPGLVWLNLVPFLNLVWLILSIIKVGESLQNEYSERELRGDGDFGKTMGIIFYVTTIIGCAPINLIFLVMYAQKLGGYIEELESRSSRRPRADDRDIDDNDD